MNIFNTFPTLSTGLQAFGLTLFHSLWQGIAIGLLCTLVLKVMHKKMAALRFIVAFTALILLFLSFTGTFYVQYQALSPAVQEVSFNTAAPGKEIPVTINTASSQEDLWTAVTAFYRQCVQKLIAYAPFIVAFWFLGFLWYTTQLTMGLYQTRQMKRKSYLPEGKWASLLQHLQHKLKMQRRIQLLISSQADAPFTLGWLKPVILLPPGIFTELSADQLETILVHELAHIKRHDYLLNIIQSIIEVFLFFNPAYWYLAGVLEKEREQACDQITISTLHHPMVYARALTRLAEISHNTSSDIAVAAIGKQYLRQRIHNIMQNSSYTSHRSRPAAFKWYQLVIIIALGVVLTTLTPDVQGNQTNSSAERQIPAADSVFTVNGQVTDQETGKPLAGINIIVKGATRGTVTNREGIYQIQISGPEDSLTFFFTGYEKEEIAIGRRKVVDVNMQKEDQETSEEQIGVRRAVEKALTQREEKENSSTEKIRGKVIDAETGEPLTGVKIMISNKKLGATNPKGTFAIPSVTDKDTLTFQFSGYKTAQLPVGRYTVRADVALRSFENDPVKDLKNEQNIIYVIDERKALIGGEVHKVIYDIGPENITSIEVAESKKKQEWLKKYNTHQYDEVVLIKTKKGLKRELSNKAHLDNIADQLNKVINEAPQSSRDSLRIKATENKHYSQPDTSENILYILDGVVQDSDKKILNEIDPLDIKSVEVFKNNSESFNSIAQTYLKGAKQTYDRIILIKTKGKNSPDLSNMEDQAFDNKLIVFPNPSDDQLSVQFQLEKAVYVRIEVIDINGQPIALLANQIYEPGVYQAEWREAVQKSGWYVIKVTKGDQVFTRKVALE